MPRRNNRKHYIGEGILGFNPDKYIIGSGYNRRVHKPDNRCDDVYVQRVSWVERPSHDRHKARSDNQRKRRAMSKLRRMQAPAELIDATGICDLPMPDKNIIGARTNEPEHAEEHTADRMTTNNTIFGGFITWLKKRNLFQ